MATVNENAIYESGVAGASLVGKENFAVKFGTTGWVLATDGTGDGILVEGAASAGIVTVQRGGKGKAYVGEDVTAGVWVTSDANGKLRIVDTADDRVIGKTRTAADTSNGEMTEIVFEFWKFKV